MCVWGGGGIIVTSHLASHCILFPSHPITSHHLPSPPGSKYKYVAQDFGENSCSQGKPVDTEAECRQAALAVKKSSNLTYIGSWPAWPKGCSAGSDGNWDFNKHSTGAGRSDESPVCKVKGRYSPHPPHADAKQDTYHLDSPHLTSPHLISVCAWCCSIQSDINLLTCSYPRG